MSNIILTTQSELEALIRNSILKALNESRQEAKEDSKHLLTIEQASEFLNLAKQTLYGFTSKNQIPFIKRAKKLYFRKEDLTNWLLKGKYLTQEEIEKGGFEGLKIKKGGKNG